MNQRRGNDQSGQDESESNADQAPIDGGASGKKWDWGSDTRVGYRTRDDDDTPEPPLSKAGAVYGQHITELLASEYERRKTLETRR